MTNSFLSENSFRPQASPVDTYVRPSTVAPATGISQLAKALKGINPALQTYLDFEIKKDIEEEQQEGAEMAIEESVQGFKSITKSIRKKDGDDAAKQLIGGSIFADRAYQRTKADILGNNVKSKLQNSYATTKINGQPLSAYKFESPEFQDWLEEQRNTVVDQLGDINSTYVNKYFIPKLIDATGTITNHHIKQYKEFKFEELKSLSSPIVSQVIALDTDSAKELIQSYENSMNNLGISGKDRQGINKAIVDALKAEAETVGLNGDEERAEDILELAGLFPYGPGGKLSLKEHPDFKEGANQLKRRLADISWKNAQREEIEKKRANDNDVVESLKNYASALSNDDPSANKILDDLILRQPDKAAKIQTNQSALDGDTRERYAALQKRIIDGDFNSEGDAAIAALDWFQDPRTPKTAANINLFNDLIRYADKVESGQFTEINKALSELKSQISNEFRKDGNSNIFGQLNGTASKDVNDLYNRASDELRLWRLGLDKDPTPIEEFEKIKEIRDKYLEEARKKTNPFGDELNNQPEESLPGVPNISPLNKKSNNQTKQEIPNISSSNNQNTDEASQKQNKSVFDFFIGNYYKPQIINSSALEALLENNIVTPTKGNRFVDQKGNYYQLEKGSVMPSMMTDTSEEYEVETGDTLTNLAEQFSTTVKEIMDANNLTDEDFIQIGQKLMMPINTIGDALVSESDLQNPSVLEEIDITKPFTFNSLERLAAEQGFTPKEARIMAAIALAESGGNAQIDTVQSGLDPEKKNEFSLGLWQINMIKDFASERRKAFKIQSDQELYNPAVNARAAKIMFDKQGFEAWGAYTDESYKKFLPKTN